MVILTEKDTVAQSIADALGAKKKDIMEYDTDGIRIVHAQGHLYRLADPEEYDPSLARWQAGSLPIVPEKFLYKPIKGKKDMRSRIKEAIAAEADSKGELVIATDADREGEVIARMILMHCKTEGLRISRYWVSESMEKDVVKEGLAQRKPDAEYNAIARQGLETKKSDWIFGINMTRAYTLLMQNGVSSIGRVQSAVLREIYEREEAIRNHKSETYFKIEVKLRDGSIGYLVNGDTGKFTFKNKNDVQIRNFISSSPAGWTVKGASVKTEEISAPQLYNTSGIMADAYRLYGVRLSDCMDMLEELYNTDKALSYPRTKSRVLGGDNENTARKVFTRLSPLYNGTPASERNIDVKDKQVFDTSGTDGHHGLIPEKMMKDDGSVKYKIWKLAADRFMLQFAGRWIRNRIGFDVVTDAGVIRFGGVETVQPGWTAIDRTVERKESVCGRYRDGDNVEASVRELKEEKTQPPKHYTEGTVIMWMENPRNEEGGKYLSIGTDATRAAIVKTLFDRKYLGTVMKHIEITDKGTALIRYMMHNKELYDCIGVAQTTEWDAIVTQAPTELTKRIAATVRTAIDNIRGDMKTAEVNSSYGTCPVCGKGIYEGEKNWYCGGYKDGCKVSVSKHVMGNTIDEDKIRTLFRDGKLPVMHGVKTDGTETDFEIMTDKIDGIKFVYLDDMPVCKCPFCGGAVRQYKSSFTCENNKKGDAGTCDFIMWKEAFGGKWTAEMVKRICTGETLKDVGCSSKEGKKYKAQFRLNIATHTLEKTSKHTSEDKNDGQDEE